jgi:hypothetical protein
MKVTIWYDESGDCPRCEDMRRALEKLVGVQTILRSSGRFKAPKDALDIQALGQLQFQNLSLPVVYAHLKLSRAEASESESEDAKWGVVDYSAGRFITRIEELVDLLRE